MATVSNFALRLPPSLMEDVKALAAQDAVSVESIRRPGNGREGGGTEGAGLSHGTG